MLSRQMAAALPAPLAVVSLHDGPRTDGSSFDLRVAGGNRAVFCREVAQLLPFCTSETVVVCSHLHLAPVAWLLRARASRLVVVLCGIEAWVPLRAAERWALGASDVVAISAHTARCFVETNPAFAGVAVTVVHPGLPDAAAAADRSQGTRPIALVVGRMAVEEGYKGHDALIEVWPRVLERHPAAQLVIVGDGTDRTRLEALAIGGGLRDAVVFTGRIDDGALRDLYSRAQLFVMPSRDEGFGFVFLEAMRAGTPCIGARGAAEEIIEHGATGLIVDPADSTDILGAILRLFDDPGLCRRFGAAGRERFLERFTSDAFRSRFARACEFDVAVR